MAAHRSDPRLSRVIAVINGKGGVGKTSVTANAAGILASNDFQVLAIDLDLSGNLGLDLGYAGDPGIDDRGQGVVDAIWKDGTLEPHADPRRANLDILAGGNLLELLAAMQNSHGVSGDVPTTFASKLADIAEDYDVILLDCAPGNPVLQQMALTAARYVLIPTRTDPGSWEGLRMVGPRVRQLREGPRPANPDIVYLGAVLFGHQTTARGVLRETKARMDEFGAKVPLFQSVIRHSETSAQQTRSRGQLAHELAQDAAGATAQRLNLLRNRKNGEPLPAALSGTASSLAGDYQNLVTELMTRIAQHEEQVGAPAEGSTGGTQVQP